MKPLFSAPKAAPEQAHRLREGEDDRVLRAVQVVVDEGSAARWIGRPSVIAQRRAFGLRLKEGVTATWSTQETTARSDYWQEYHQMPSARA